MLIQLIDLLFLVYTAMIFIRILGSWVPEWSHHRFMLFISFYTDPYLNFFRRFVPPLGMLDISPIVAFFCLGIMKRFIQYLLLSLS
jgi:YggT family protein